MNFEYFIARHIQSRTSGGFSGPIIRIAIVSVALSLTIMLLSVAVLTGFQQAIRQKVIGFAGHIQVLHYDSNNSYEPQPILKNMALPDTMLTLPGVETVQQFATKAGLIKTDTDIHGIVLKGVDYVYDWSYFAQRMVEGQVPHISDSAVCNQVIISRTVSDLLKLHVGDPLRVYFINNDQTRGRRFVISGIYATGLDEFDRAFVLGDIHHIRKLNGWTDQQTGGYEVLLHDYRDMDGVAKAVYDITGYDLDVITVKKLYPQIFDWLALQDMNVVIILIIMVLVSGIAMISTLLVLILEHTTTIGLLKAMGAVNGSVRKVFLYHALHIIGKGLFWGNMIALSLIFVQYQWGVITLPEASYYVSVVPVAMSVTSLLLVNAGTVSLCLFMLLLPSMVVSRVSPLKAIRFS